MAVDVQEEYVYLFLVVDLDPTPPPVFPNAKIPREQFPAAAPADEAVLAPPTPVAVEVQQAYVYLLRVVSRLQGVVAPRAKIPRVEFPAAEPSYVATLAPPTPEAVDVQDEYMYLFRTAVRDKPPRPIQPRANIPRVEFPAADPAKVFVLEVAPDLLVHVA